MKRQLSARSDRAGSAVVLVVLLIVGLASIAASLAMMTGSGYLENRSNRESMRAFHLCEAGLNEAWATLSLHGEEALVESTLRPIELGPSTIDVEVTLGSAASDLAADRIRLVASAQDGRSRSASTLTVRKEPNGLFRYALFGNRGVVLESNAYIDSFNSAAGAYDPDDHGALADVGSNEDVELHANIEVHGSIYPGPDGVIDDSAPQTLVTGVMQQADSVVEIDPIEVPSIRREPSRTIRSTATIGPGDFHYRGLTVAGGADLRIVGPTRLVLDDFRLRSNANIVLDASAGPIEIHCLGDVQIRSNSSLDSIASDPRDILLNIAWDDDDDDDEREVVLASNSSFFGTIYGPNVDLVINSTFEIFGGVRVGSIHMESNAQVHFDERLLFDSDKEIEYEIVSWTPSTPSRD